MTTQAPSFSPKGGIGSIWKDSSGKTWKYTPTGWVESGTEAIVTDNKNKDTFVVKPEDTEIVNTLKSGGAKETDIQLALQKRQEILAAKPAESTDVVTNTIGVKKYDPFAGKTKVEVLRDAFNHGVTSNKELDELGKTYDMIASPADTQATPEDISKLPVAQQQAIKESLRKTVATKGMALPDATTRSGVVGTIGVLDTGQQIIDMIEGSSGKPGIQTGPIAGTERTGVSVFGVKVPGKRALGKTTAEEDKLAALMTIYTAKFMQSISGAAISDREVERLMNALPGEGKQEQANIEGIKAISDYLSSTYGPMIGVDMTPLVPTSGNAKDPLKILQNGDNSKNPLGI